MKKSLSVVALLLALLMIAMCCVACGDDKKEEKPSESGQAAATEAAATEAAATEAGGAGTNAGIIGKWSCNFDISKMMNVMLDTYMNSEEGAAMTADQVEIMKKLYGDLSVYMTLEFKEDGTCTTGTDEASANALVEQLKKNIKTYMSDVLTMMGLTEADLEANGYNVDTFADYYASQLDTKSINLNSTNAYRYEGDKLYMASEGEQISEDRYLEVSVTASTLTVTGVQNPEIGENIEMSSFFSEAMLPLTFNRV